LFLWASVSGGIVLPWCRVKAVFYIAVLCFMYCLCCRINWDWENFALIREGYSAVQMMRKFPARNWSRSRLCFALLLSASTRRATLLGTRRQHPLTGYRAANYRLLANQWAERRLVTQWRHGCRAMRRNVCNAGASNAGRSLCVQISRERSYPLPIYWYRSRGNWLRYNFAADSFYIMKLCSRLFVIYCRNYPKDDKFRHFIPILTKLCAAQNLDCARWKARV